MTVIPVFAYRRVKCSRNSAKSWSVRNASSESAQRDCPRRKWRMASRFDAPRTVPGLHRSRGSMTGQDRCKGLRDLASILDGGPCQIKNKKTASFIEQPRLSSLSGLDVDSITFPLICIHRPTFFDLDISSNSSQVIFLWPNGTSTGRKHGIAAFSTIDPNRPLHFR